MIQLSGGSFFAFTFTVTFARTRDIGLGSGYGYGYGYGRSVSRHLALKWQGFCEEHRFSSSLNIIHFVQMEGSDCCGCCCGGGDCCQPTSFLQLTHGIQTAAGQPQPQALFKDEWAWGYPKY
ncbi:hypothetical protein [Alcaligenes faecalis]|uniref:hypothetical protein n=1 Tax=Alcaligenes faecalis TaxID=511 RepID=UPI00293376AA|nr:hypothetical protein [Alcaligenes faecalis]MDV2117113.1 hypothetical protein [Alcaligenes faecalis]